jgi:XTP/dITP diphosphohydrolase
MFEILAATNNGHKVEEYRKLLKDLEVEIISLAEFSDFPETIEDGATFEENAKKKALEASDFTEMPAFADDSGLEVEALGGAPGINSSRYAGPEADDAARISKLLEELADKANRRARFICVIAIANEGEVIETFRGEVSGVISEAPKGDGGFGYDPVFIPDGYNETFAELGSDVKDKISHRARAAQAAIEYIEDELSTIDDFDM